MATSAQGIKALKKLLDEERWYLKEILEVLTGRQIQTSIPTLSRIYNEKRECEPEIAKVLVELTNKKTSIGRRS